MNTVKIDFENGVAWVAMNRPEKKNAISVEMAREMAQAMSGVSAPPKHQPFTMAMVGFG